MSREVVLRVNDEFTARGKNPGVSWDMSPRRKSESHPKIDPWVEE